MPKFLLKATYTSDGAKGLLKEGGTKRRAAVQKIIEAARRQARGVLLRVRR